MSLPSNLISEFVRITNDNEKPKTESTTYGTIVKDGSNTYVKLDGSDILTPATTTADAQNGERVTVLIKNHTATVTGNISSPAARTGDVQQFGTEINVLSEDNIAINGKLTAAEADISSLKTDKLDTATAEITYATIENLNAIDAKIDNLQSAENGSSGVWSYKKWSDGDVELWGSQEISGVSCSTLFGGSMYRSDALTAVAFPFSVYSPNLTASYESNGYGAMLWATSMATESSPPSYYLICETSGTITSGKINFHVFGKWKV